MRKIINSIFNSFSKRKQEKIIQQTIPHGEIKWEDTVKYIPPVFCGKVIKVYDGDTVTIACYVNKNKKVIYRFPVRLAGIDCPEKFSKDELEKEVASIAQKKLRDELFGKVITLTNVSTDKYGRILANVMSNGYDMSEFLLNKRLAVPYDGKTRHSPNCWMKYYTTGKFQ
jgi:endonuclease YncB( thermonuclease family)